MDSGNSGPVVRIPCTFPGCQCREFKPSTDAPRQCSLCAHGWVPHALEKMGIIYDWPTGKYDTRTFDAVFDVASLILYGTQAIPLRLHVCLYRLLCTFENQEDSVRIAGIFGWPWDDVVRGHKLDDGNNGIRNHWVYASLTDETMILGHFLKFKTTQAIATSFLRELNEHKNEENPYIRKCVPTEPTLQAFFVQNQRQNPSLFVTSTANQNGTPLQNAQKQLVFRGVNSTPMIHQENGGNAYLVRTLQSPNPPLPNPVETNHNQPPFSINLNQQQQPTQSPVSHTTGKRKIQPKPAGATQTPPAVSYEANPLVPTTSTPAVVSPVPFAPSPLPKEAKKSDAGKSDTPHTSRKSPSKRVQCENCQKTFCDKGALKIHYSAVHLKEMHRCNMPGCNMMFSSRRSRNRHSSNTNPRLHQNMFAPRRGGILASPEDLPPHGEKSIVDNLVMSDSDDEDDRRSISYEEVSPKMEEMDESEARLIIADDVKEEMSANIIEPTAPISKRFRADMSTLISSTMATDAPTMVNFMNPRRSADPNLDSVRLNFKKMAARSRSQHGGRMNNGMKTMASRDFSDEDNEMGSAHSEPSGSPQSGVVLDVQFDVHGKPIIPTDPTDSNKCLVCAKVFKNHFTFRTHYINVHLRLMHACTIEGCSSQFPSVRSRDRHSQNLNLHQTILEQQHSVVVPAYIEMTDGEDQKPEDLLTNAD